MRTPFCGRIDCKSPAEVAAEQAAVPSGELAVWDQAADAVAVSIDTATLDAKIAAMREAEAFYQAKRKESNEASDQFEMLRREVLTILKLAHKSKYHVDGLGTAYIMKKFQVRVPKSIEAKRELFKFYSKEGILLEVATINHQTLNADFNERREKDPAFKMPGVEEPTTEELIGFRKDRT